MAFAVLYNVWHDPQTKEELYTFTIITTTPNNVVGQFHDRQPVQLSFDGVLEWLNPDLVEPEHAMKSLKPIDEKEMEEWHVADEAKNPRNEGEELIKPK